LIPVSITAIAICFNLIGVTLGVENLAKSYWLEAYIRYRTKNPSYSRQKSHFFAISIIAVNLFSLLLNLLVWFDIY
jgi:hypothetical protein